jgi:hypothetical protein
MSAARRISHIVRHSALEKQRVADIRAQTVANSDYNNHPNSLRLRELPQTIHQEYRHTGLFLFRPILVLIFHSTIVPLLT